MLAISIAAVAHASARAEPPDLISRPIATLEVKSPAFAHGAAIPSEYTCDGDDVSPPLTWSPVPKGTKSIAVLVDDPDAPGGIHTHWLVTGISPEETKLVRGTAMPRGSRAARNDMGYAGWMGPCPTSGRHRYRFRVYALDTTPRGISTRIDFGAAIRGHVLATGELIGTYENRSR